MIAEEKVTLTYDVRQACKCRKISKTQERTPARLLKKKENNRTKQNKNKTNRNRDMHYTYAHWKPNRCEQNLARASSPKRSGIMDRSESSPDTATLTDPSRATTNFFYSSRREQWSVVSAHALACQPKKDSPNPPKICLSKIF